MAVTMGTAGAAAASSPAQLYISPQLAAYRNQIRRQRRRRYLGIAAVAISAMWLAMALLTYFNLAPGGTIGVGLAVSALVIVAALLYEASRKPGMGETARTLDALLDDRQRMVTAVELIGAEAGASPVAQAQLETTAEMLRGADPRTMYPARVPWPQLAIAGGLLFLALGVFIMKGASDDYNLVTGGLPPSRDAAGVVATPTPESELPGSGQQAQPEPEGESPSSNPQPSTGQEGTPDPNSLTPMTPEEAARQAAQAREKQAALQRLAQALDEQSSTQGAADSIRRGEYGGASEQLTELGEQNDQLSDTAKHGLAESIHLEEGSGISRGNRFTARGLARLLHLFEPHAALLRSGATWEVG